MSQGLQSIIAGFSANGLICISKGSTVLPTLAWRDFAYAIATQRGTP